VHRHRLAGQAGLAVEVEAQRAVGQILPAQDRLGALAVKTAPAMRIPGQHDPVAAGQPGDGASAVGHLTGGFMAKHGGQRDRQCAFDGLQVGVAEAGSVNADQNVAGGERADVNRLDRHGCPGLAQDSGSGLGHGVFPPGFNLVV